MDLVTSFLPFLDKGYSGYVVAFMFLVLNITQFLSARSKLKGSLYERAFDGAMNRQNDLDQKQNTLMDSLQEEVVAVRKEIREMMVESKAEQERYRELFNQYMSVLKEKSDLMELMDEMKAANRELTERLQAVEDELQKTKEQK